MDASALPIDDRIYLKAGTNGKRLHIATASAGEASPQRLAAEAIAYCGRSGRIIVPGDVLEICAVCARYAPRSARSNAPSLLRARRKPFLPIFLNQPPGEWLVGDHKLGDAVEVVDRPTANRIISLAWERVHESLIVDSLDDMIEETHRRHT